jgi:hypothetical protein
MVDEDTLVRSAVPVFIISTITLLVIFIVLVTGKIEFETGVWIIASMAALGLTSYYIIVMTGRRSSDIERIYIPLVMTLMIFTFIVSINIWHRNYTGKEDDRGFIGTAFATLGLLFIYLLLIGGLGHTYASPGRKFFFYLMALIILGTYIGLTASKLTNDGGSNSPAIISVLVVSGLLLFVMFISLSFQRKIFAGFEITDLNESKDLEVVERVSRLTNDQRMSLLNGTGDGGSLENIALARGIRENVKRANIPQIVKDLELASSESRKGTDVKINKSLLSMVGKNEQDWNDSAALNRVNIIGAIQSRLLAQKFSGDDNELRGVEI